MARRSLCSQSECRRPAHANGLCQKHYDKVRRAARGRSAPAGSKTCRVPGCSRRYHARGYCQKHYDLFRKRTGMRANGESDPGAPGARDDDGCRVPGCDRPHHAKGYCKSHYSRLRRKGAIPRDAAKPEGVCQIDGCNRPAVAHGRCAKHLGHPVDQPARLLGKSERLKLIKQRHGIIKREIAMINRALEDED